MPSQSGSEGKAEAHKAPKPEKEERRGNHGATREHQTKANQRPRRRWRAARLRAAKPREHPEWKARNEDTREELRRAKFFFEEIS